jgi:hypothetical protein
MSEKATATAAPEKASHRSRGTKPDGGRASQLVSENPFAGLQQTLGNQAMLQLLEAGVVQAKLRVSQPGDADEQEADRAAERVVSGARAPKIHRKCTCAGGAKYAGEEDRTIQRSVAVPLLRTSKPSIQRAPAEQSSTPAGASEKTAHQPQQATHPLVVEDDAEKVEPYQMRKSQFIALLRSDACATADAVLMSVGHTAKGCPYIEKWLGFYERKSSQHIAAAMQKYAPETARARSAHEAIRLLVLRIQKAAIIWAKTGRLEGLPPEMASEISGGEGLLGRLHNFATTGVAGAIFGFIGGAGKKEDSGSSGVMRKAQGADRAPAHDASAVRSQLGSGHTLDSRAQSRMSSAFGHDFSSVRVHTDSSAAKLSSDLQARAFTIGNDVAFASGEYRPGTLIGDALIAHELAHVVQQSGTKAQGPIDKREGEYNALEADADQAATGVAISLWGAPHGGQRNKRATPNLQSSLRLQRCGGTANKAAAEAPKKLEACAPIERKDWEASVTAAQAIKDSGKKTDALLHLVQQALCGTGTDVIMTGTKHTGRVDADDYQPYPKVNFDINLNSKLPAGTSTSVEEDRGYSFSHGSKGYVVLGPKAIDPGSPLITRMVKEHEEYHVQHHLLTPGASSSRSAEEELETWTIDFTKYFHEFVHIPYAQRPLWTPLLKYYEASDPKAQGAALEKLVRYYSSMPVPPKELPKYQKALINWIHRTRRRTDVAQMQLLNDLEPRLKPPSASSSTSDE